jgi:hypothetical protein
VSAPAPAPGRATVAPRASRLWAQRRGGATAAPLATLLLGHRYTNISPDEDSVEMLPPLSLALPPPACAPEAPAASPACVIIAAAPAEAAGSAGSAASAGASSCGSAAWADTVGALREATQAATAPLRRQRAFADTAACAACAACAAAPPRDADVDAALRALACAADDAEGDAAMECDAPIGTPAPPKTGRKRARSATPPPLSAEGSAAERQEGSPSDAGSDAWFAAAGAVVMESGGASRFGAPQAAPPPSWLRSTLARA